MANKHLDLNDRIIILKSVIENKTIRQIALMLNISASTVSRELFRNRVIKSPNNYNNAKDLNKCTSFRLTKAFWVCNGCKNYTHCRKLKFVYHPEDAHNKYLNTLVKSRTGYKCSKEYLDYLNKLLVPLIKEKGQSVAHVYANLQDEIGLSKSTLYRYIDKGFLKIKNIDLPKRVIYPKTYIKQKPETKDTSIKKHRTYKDFLVFKANLPKANIIEMDLVIGKKGKTEKVLLTLLLRDSNFMMIFLRDNNSSQSVVDVFDYLERTIGRVAFNSIFNILLTDNGSEFSRVDKLERNDRKQNRCNIFYCDARASQQKGKLERNHTYIRKYFPQGTSFNNLNQSDVDVMVNHINSVKRDSLNGKSCFECLTKTQQAAIKKTRI